MTEQLERTRNIYFIIKKMQEANRTVEEWYIKWTLDFMKRKQKHFYKKGNQYFKETKSIWTAIGKGDMV